MEDVGRKLDLLGICKPVKSNCQLIHQNFVLFGQPVTVDLSIYHILRGQLE